MEDHASNLERVSARIACVVVKFWHARSASAEPEFHAHELVADVLRVAPGTAPDSPSRILRLLKRERRINYELVSRRKSLYRALPLERQLGMF